MNYMIIKLDKEKAVDKNPIPLYNKSHGDIRDTRYIPQLNKGNL